MDSMEHKKSSEDVLGQLRHAMRDSFTGKITFERDTVFLKNGILCNVFNMDDRFWLLRRLFCSQFIEEEYACELQDSDQPFRAWHVVTHVFGE